MQPMSVLWMMVFCFGCASALAPLERFPSDLPSTDAERLLDLGRLAPLVARGARGTVFMSLGLLGLLCDAASSLAVSALLVLILLTVAAIAMAAFSLHDVGTRLIDVRRCTQISSHTTLWTGVLSFAEGLMRPGRAGAFLLCLSVVALAASRVSFVLAGATNDLLELSGD